jgi:hypothetical protein
MGFLLASAAWAQASDAPPAPGLRVDQDVIHRIPLGRALDALPELAPGARQDPYGVSLNGATSAETGYRVDDLSTSDPVFLLYDSPLSIELLQEVNILTSAYLPDYGRSSGSLVRAVTRTGSNEFHGSVFGTWAPGTFEGERKLVIDEGSVVTSSNRLKNLGDFGVTLSGPLFKDRLWLVAGVIPSFTRYEHIRNIRSVPEATSTSFADARSLQYLAKGTFSPNESHTVSLSFTGNQARTGSTIQTRVSTTALGLKYSGAFLDRKLLFDVNAGLLQVGATSQPGDVLGPSQVLAVDLLTGDSRDRYQANLKATYLLDLLGTHVLKAGVDTDLLSYSWQKAYGGGVIFPERLVGRAEVSEQQISKSTVVGGFLQDSWTLADRVTLNLGVRYDVQSLYSGDDELALTLGSQLSPRLGAIVDPWADGQMKLFAHFARYYEQVPLHLLERAFPPRRRFSDGSVAPSSQHEPVDPNLEAQSSLEWVAGGEYMVLANTRLGASYTRRDMGAVIQDMSRDNGNTYFLGNPGHGFAGGFPKAVRDYDAVTLYLNRAFADSWLVHASYTWSRLRGNYLGLLQLEHSQLASESLSDFDPSELLDNRSGALPLDRRHTLKVFGARDFQLTGALSTSIGLAYRGYSGAPINAFGAHPEHGQDEVFVLPRGTVGRTPWVNIIDSKVGLNYRFGKNHLLSATLEVFNLFNFQAATRVDETYTYESVVPVKDGSTSDLPTPSSPGRVRLNTGDPAHEEYLTYEQVNPNFGRPSQYQSPRQVRLGVRYTF